MTKLTPAQKKDLAALLATPKRYCDLRTILDDYMPKTVYRVRKSFERALREEGLLHDLSLRAQTGQTTPLFSSRAVEDWTPYEVAQALEPTGYFCNLTAIYYHSLTNQVPVTIYLATEGNREKDQKHGKSPGLTDDAIFQAFMLPHRMTRHILTFQKREIVITERVARKETGVETVHAIDRICPKGTRVTGLERAIIDAVVLPQYNGGLRTTIDAFRQSLPRLNHRRLLELYDDLAYVYPYWQTIGFLADRLDSPNLANAIRQKYKRGRHFYLDHGAKTSWQFDEKWNLSYPKGVI